MPLLLTIWSIAATILLGIVGYARLRACVGEMLPQNSPRGMGDFIGRELHELIRVCQQLVVRAQPHGARAAATVAMVAKKGHDAFLGRVFGRMTKLEKGNSSSFFLKYIAEHKEMMKRENSESKEKDL